LTTRFASSTVVASVSSIVPISGFGCAGRVIESAARAVSRLRSGHAIACGWYTVTVVPSRWIVCGQEAAAAACASSAAGVSGCCARSWCVESSTSHTSERTVATRRMTARVACDGGEWGAVGWVILPPAGSFAG